MRPRINSFGNIKFKELQEYLNSKQIYGHTIKINDDNTYTYSFAIMHRNTRKKPNNLFINVSQTSKNVIGAYESTGKRFNNINELKLYYK